MNCFEKCIGSLPNRNKIYQYRYELFLLVLTGIGLSLKFVYVLFRLNYQSDNVFGGMASIEFWKYHNFLLWGYYLPSDDINFFEVIVFHVMPQFLSGYNPLMLKVSTCVIFSLIILIFSYFVYRLTNNVLNCLFFSAVLSNWYIDYYSTILWITSHESTILMIGLLLVLYFFKPLKYWEILFFGILALITFSDSLILVWFTVPFLFVIMLDRLMTQTIKEQIVSFFKFDFVFKIIVISGILMIVKKFLIPYYVEHTHVFHNLGIENLVTVQVPVLFQHFTLLIDPNLYHVINHTNPISVIDIVFIFLFVGYVILVINYLKSHPTEDVRTFCMFTGAAFIASSLLYITTAFAVQLQYLKFLLICLLIIFCLVDFNKVRFAKFALLGIIFINLFLCVTLDASLNSTHDPNEDQYNLIDFLKSENLTFGFGDYWDANVVTYLSHEDVIIRSIWIDNGVVPRYWNSAERWYRNIPQKYFVIVRKTDEHAINYFNNTFQPKYTRVLDYQNYKIFEYNLSGIHYTYNVVNLSHIGGNAVYDPLLNNDTWYSNDTIWGYVVYGPYVLLPDGSYQVNYRLKIDGTPTQNLSIARIEVSSNKILNQSTIYTTAMLNDTYQTFSLKFESDSSVPLEFRVYKYPNSTLFIGNIDVEVTSLNNR